MGEVNTVDRSTSSSSLLTEHRLRAHHPIRSTNRALRCALRWLATLARVAGRWAKTLGARALHWLQSEPDLLASSRRPRKARSTRHERRLVADCEAFLAGRYPRRLPRRRRWDWAWVNTLARASRAEIEDLARTRTTRGRAAAFAAAEVLATGDRPGLGLERLQARFLVPVEVECMSSRSLSAAATTHRVLRALRTARAHPDSAAPRVADE